MRRELPGSPEAAAVGGMNEVAPGVWQLSGFPPHVVNVYLAGDVLIDAATRWARYRVLRQLRGRAVSLVALTHCHPDHQGTARLVCDHFGVPLACHEADADGMEGRTPMAPANRIVRLGARLFAGLPFPVTHRLRDGDRVAGFRVVHAAGHTPGHVMYHREADGVVLAGDVLTSMGLLFGRGLREPPNFFSVDPEENRRSVRRLLELRPRVVCFGHGPPLRDVGRLEELVRSWTR
jgi:glyoxylase-like metal-dependent hydrolase (beta-lactamase superfamily II)